MSATATGEVYDHERFKKWLEDAMANAGVTNFSQLGKMTKSAPTTIYRWVDGTARPSPATLRILCESLQTEILDAYVHAGYLSEEEASVGPDRGVESYSTKRLLQEVLKRVE